MIRRGGRAWKGKRHLSVHHIFPRDLNVLGAHPPPHSTTPILRRLSDMAKQHHSRSRLCHLLPSQPYRLCCMQIPLTIYPFLRPSILSLMLIPGAEPLVLALRRVAYV